MKTIPMQQAKERLGYRTNAQLAKHLRITPQAVGQWPDGRVPMSSYVRLNRLNPRIFPMPYKDSE